MSFNDVAASLIPSRLARKITARDGERFPDRGRVADGSPVKRNFTAARRLVQGGLPVWGALHSGLMLLRESADFKAKNALPLVGIVFEVGAIVGGAWPLAPLVVLGVAAEQWTHATVDYVQGLAHLKQHQDLVKAYGGGSAVDSTDGTAA